VRVMVRAQFMGAVRLLIWICVSLFGLAVTISRRLDVSRWATRLVHPHTVFDAQSRQPEVSAEASSAVDVAHHNGMRLIEHCEASAVVNDTQATKAL